MSGKSDSPDAVVEFLKSLDLAESGRVEVLWHQKLRHTTILASGADGRCWLVKQRGAALVQENPSLQGEADFYGRLQSGQLPPRLRSMVPRFVSRAEDAAWLVLEGYRSHSTAKASLTIGFVDTELLPVFLGESLAILHSAPRPDEVTAPYSVKNPIRDLTSCTPEGLAERPPVYREFLRLLQADECLGPRILELRHDWQSASVIHGDLRLENLLVPMEHTASTGPLIVDWELWGLGDWRWDCATLIGSYLLGSLEACLMGEADIDLVTQQQGVNEAITKFWSTYEGIRADEAGFDNEAGGRDVFAWAGYWLLLRLLQLLPTRRALTTVDLAAINIAAKLLLPDEQGARRAASKG